jgi:hypothetical protein
MYMRLWPLTIEGCACGILYRAFNGLPGYDRNTVSSSRTGALHWVRTHLSPGQLSNGEVSAAEGRIVSGQPRLHRLAQENVGSCFRTESRLLFRDILRFFIRGREFHFSTRVRELMQLHVRTFGLSVGVTPSPSSTHLFQPVGDKGKHPTASPFHHETPIKAATNIHNGHASPACCGQQLPSIPGTAASRGGEESPVHNFAFDSVIVNINVVRSPFHRTRRLLQRRK